MNFPPLNKDIEASNFILSIKLLFLSI